MDRGGRLVTKTLVLLVLLQLCTSSRLSHRIARIQAETDWELTERELAEGKQLRVAIVNPYAFCFELVFALAYNLNAIGCQLDLFLHNAHTHYGVPEFLEQELGLAVNIQPYENFTAETAKAFKAVVYADWNPAGMGPSKDTDKALQAVLDSGYAGKVILTVNEAYSLLPDSIWPGNPTAWDMWKKPLVDVLADKRVRLMAIAPHVARFFEEKRLLRVEIDKPVGWYLPVFPFREEQLLAQGFDQHQGFVIQGNLEAYRRNYSGVFADLVASPDLLEMPGFKLNLVGNGKLDMPEVIKEKVAVHAGLAFQDYYATIQNGNIGLALAFASGRYYSGEAASSSLATSIITGMPLIGDQKLLDVYEFLPKHAIWYKEPGESDVQAMQRVAAMDPEDIREKFYLVKRLRDANMARTQRVLRENLGIPLSSMTSAKIKGAE